MADERNQAKQWAMAWLIMGLLLALHVLDEALTGFLPRYNTMVTSIKETWSWFPFPVFSFEAWISGLVAGIALVFLLALVARKGQGWLLPLAYLFGGIMSLNGLGHMAMSLVLGELFPGVLSSMLVLPGSLWFLMRTRTFHRSRQARRSK